MAGFTVSSLSNYTIEDKADLKLKGVYGAVSMPLFTVREGIKSSEKLPYVTTDPAMQADTTCATVNASGDGGTFAQMTLSVTGIKFEDSWCFKDLESKFTQKYLRAGAKIDENAATALLDQIMTDYTARIAKKMEMAIWQSATTNTFSTDLKQFNGFLKTLDAAGGYVNSQTYASTSVTAITTSNVISIFQNQWLATPADLKRNDNLITVCGDDTFDKLLIALANANLYHYNGNNGLPSREITLFGTSMKIKAVPGLNADNNSNLPAAYKNRIITFEKDNLVVGTDLISDMDDWATWYEMKDDKLYTRNRYKIATGIFFTDRVVSFATV